MKRAKELETIMILSAACIVFSLVSHRRIFVVSALALLIIGLLSKEITSGLSSIWLKFSEVLGAFNTKVILTLVFFVILSPLAFFYRASSKNPLLVKRVKDRQTLFHPRDHLPKREDFEKLW